MAEAKSFAVWLSIGGLLVFGTMVTILSKSAYEVYGYGIEDATHAAYHTFQKPWALVLIMFIGMSWCLVIAEFQKCKMRGRQTALGEPLLNNEEALPSNGHSLKSLYIIVPAVADLIATVLMNLGLVHITASVYQMLRGAELLFAAIFSVTFLKRKLNYMHLNGLVLCVLGVAMVGGSSLMSGDSKKGETTQTVLYGMGLVVLSQMVQAVQLTFEDYFLADLNMGPMQVVGFEGLFGMIMMFAVVMPAIMFLPGSDIGGVQENSLDSIELIKSSNIILAIVISQMVCMLAYNFAGMCVTDHLGAVFRTILETLRTMFVWAVDCYLYYFTSTGLGEGLTKYSLLQLAGFVVLVIGTFVYDKGDVLAAKAIAVEAAGATGADSESQAPAGESEFLMPRRPSTSVPVAFSASTTKPSMSLNAHSLSRSMAEAEGFMSASPS